MPWPWPPLNDQTGGRFIFRANGIYLNDPPTSPRRLFDHIHALNPKGVHHGVISSVLASTNLRIRCYQKLNI